MRDLDDDFFDGVEPLRRGGMDEDDEDDFDYDRYDEEEEEEEDSLDREFSADTNSNANDDERQRILCQRFEEALLEYDSDEVGDLDDECEDIVGDRPLEGDACLEAALDEFLTEREDEILIEGTGKNAERRKRTGGSGYSALVGRTMVNASELDKIIGDGVDPISSSSLMVNIEESKRQMQSDLAEADAILANPEMDLPPEEIFIDGKSYFSVTSRNPWDCESILSTYSNLDNNPVIIGRSGRRRRKKKGGDIASMTSNDVIPEDEPVRIRLSNKTGLPLRPTPDEGGKNNHDDEDYFGEGSTYLSINRGEARQRDESKQEKRDRKMAVKEERRVCRMQKKIMKEAFAEEFQKRGHDVVVDPVGGSTVFRFS
jgi:protein LTV1